MLEIVWYFLPVGEIYLEFLCYYNTYVYMFCSFYLILYIIWFQFSLSLSPFYYFDHYEHQYFTSVLFHMFSFIKNALFGSYSWISHRTFIESIAVTTAFWLDQYGGRFASIFRRCPRSMLWGQWFNHPKGHYVTWGGPRCTLMHALKGILNLPTSSLHLCSPFLTKLLGQDSPLIHLFSITIWSRFTAAKIKLGENSPSWFVFSRLRFTFK